MMAAKAAPDTRVLILNRFIRVESQQPTALLLDDVAVALRNTGFNVDAVSAEHPGSKKAYGRLMALWIMLWRGVHRPRATVVLCKSDPPFLLLIGRFLGWWHQAPVIYWCQDVYPDVLKGVSVPGPLTGLWRYLIGILAWFHGGLLKGTRHVVVPAPCLAETLKHHAMKSQRLPIITVIPNWPEPGITPVPMPDTGPLEVLYSGHYGHGHDLTDFLSLARLAAQNPGRDIRFRLCLSPRGLARWQRLHGQNPLPANLTVERFVTATALHQHLATAQIHAVAMKDAVSGSILPSKAMAACHMGRPILLFGGAGSSLQTAITQNGIGHHVPTGDAVSGLEWLNQLHDDPALLAYHGEKARDYVLAPQRYDGPSGFVALITECLQAVAVSADTDGIRFIETGLEERDA